MTFELIDSDPITSLRQRIADHISDADSLAGAVEWLINELATANVRMKFIEEDMKSDEPVAIYYDEGKFRFPYLSSNAGGFGGGVSEFHSDTLGEAIDAAVGNYYSAKR